ncbi:hypothetical protein K1719_037539 [Acacia pycnantha]|nr:hypothetical protein K1719_037539 [Acacia pycnantha]
MTTVSLHISGFLLSPSLFSQAGSSSKHAEYHFSSTQFLRVLRVAYELLLAGHRYLDLRTSEEFNAGHPPGAINIPYVYKVGSGSLAFSL